MTDHPGTPIPAALLLGAAPGPFLPEQASDVAREVDFAFYFLTGVSAVFFVILVGATLWFMWRYRARPGREPEPSPSHNTALELTWSIIPAILLVMMFWYGFKGYMDMYVPPVDAYEINVEGQKWAWSFQYPNGYIDNELHLPAGRDVTLVLTSKDVIHSLYIPAFRVKRDAVPGRYNKVSFRAIKPGEYTLFCAEYCGTSHSDMLAKVVVHEPGDFERWLKRASDIVGRMPPAEAGELLYQKRGCKQCHSTDGSPGVGPTFKGIMGRRRVLTDGSEVVVDENFIRESILYPQAKVAAGFDPVMPTFQGRLKDEEIDAIIAYLKTLK
ncbi:MAG: cytochrome c oxidase subunit II [Acidobacteria bacterium]|nr:MAG: cytochrome c oxidase subunit II [Acidobacteriota bacterium]